MSLRELNDSSVPLYKYILDKYDNNLLTENKKILRIHCVGFEIVL